MTATNGDAHDGTTEAMCERTVINGGGVYLHCYGHILPTGVCSECGQPPTVAPTPPSPDGAGHATGGGAGEVDELVKRLRNDKAMGWQHAPPLKIDMVLGLLADRDALKAAAGEAVAERDRMREAVEYALRKMEAAWDDTGVCPEFDPEDLEPLRQALGRPDAGGEGKEKP